jgi:hypothetical protein
VRYLEQYLDGAVRRVEVLLDLLKPPTDTWHQSLPARGTGWPNYTVPYQGFPGVVS